MSVWTLRNNKVHKVYQLCKEYRDSLLAIDGYKLGFILHKGGSRKEFTEHLNKLRAESIKKKRELIKSIKELDK